MGVQKFFKLHVFPSLLAPRMSVSLVVLVTKQRSAKTAKMMTENQTVKRTLRSFCKA